MTHNSYLLMEAVCKQDVLRTEIARYITVSHWYIFLRISITTTRLLLLIIRSSTLWFKNGSCTGPHVKPERGIDGTKGLATT